jgi:hypothetical protein
LAGRDKIEPFWARTSRAKRRGPPPLVIPEREPAEAAKAPPKPVAGGQPREPSFAAAGAPRHETVATPVAEPSRPDAAPAGEGETSRRQAPSLGPAAAQPAPTPDADGWVQISLAEAARERLFGVHGWLVLIAMFVALGLFRALVELVDFWATTDHGGLSAWIMAVLRSVMVLWAALILGLLIGRSRAFPTNFVAYGLVDSIYLVLFGLAFAHVTSNAVFIGAAVAIGLNLIAIAYVLRSRRVNVTYRYRVRAKQRARAEPPSREVEASPA